MGTSRMKDPETFILVTVELVTRHHLSRVRNLSRLTLTLRSSRWHRRPFIHVVGPESKEVVYYPIITHVFMLHQEVFLPKPLFMCITSGKNRQKMYLSRTPISWIRRGLTRKRIEIQSSVSLETTPLFYEKTNKKEKYWKQKTPVSFKCTSTFFILSL